MPWHAMLVFDVLAECGYRYGLYVSLHSSAEEMEGKSVILRSLGALWIVSFLSLLLSTAGSLNYVYSIHIVETMSLGYCDHGNSIAGCNITRILLLYSLLSSLPGSRTKFLRARPCLQHKARLMTV